MVGGDNGIDLRKIKRVLIIQLGDIGDIVWCIPTLRAVKESIPGVTTAVAVKGGFGDLLKMVPAVDEVFDVNPPSGGGIQERIAFHLRLIKALRSRRFDLAVDLRSGDRGAFLAFLSGAKRRVTIDYEEVPFWRNYLFTDIITPPRYVRGMRGAAEQSLRIVREIGIDTTDIVPRINVPPEVVNRVANQIKAFGISEESPRITVNPFSRWSYKELPEAKWIGLLNWLANDCGLTPVIVGSSGEREKAERIKAACSVSIVNLAGQTTLMELAGILSLSRLHIGVDSAAPHIAAAVGTQTISIYGPSDWEEWAPIGEKHHVVMPDENCAPCQQKGCDGTERSRCLEELDVEKIKKVVREALVKVN